MRDEDIKRWLDMAGHERESHMTDVTLRKYTKIVLDSIQNETLMKQEEKDYRKEIWIGVAISVAGSSNCNNPGSPASWANVVLDAFDRRFNDD